MNNLAQLRKKYETSDSLQKQMKKAQQNYQILKQRAYYGGIADQKIPFVEKFNGKKQKNIDVYFIYSVYQHIRSPTLDKFTLNFITGLPKPDKLYIIVYFNDSQFSDAFPHIKTVLEVMPFQYYSNLVKLYVVNPSFKQRASRYFVFGTIPKFLNAQMHNIYNLKQLGKQLSTQPSEIMQALPSELKDKFLQQIQLLNYQNAFGNNRANIQKKATNNQVYPPTLSLQNYSTLKLIMPPSKQKQLNRKFDIDQYPKTQNGLPQVFQILVFYFKQHPQASQQQGIFRKSASIVQQNHVIEDLIQKKYNVIDKITNPHIVANLIKRFLRQLVTPIIPYNIFYKIMQQSNLTPQFMSKKIKQLATVSMSKLLVLMFVLQFLIHDIISQQKVNKMSADNVAICFAPCLMFAKQRSMKDLQYASKSILALKVIISHFQFIFGTPKDQKKLYRSSYMESRKKQRQQALNIVENNKSVLKSSPSKGFSKNSSFYDQEGTSILKLNQSSNLKQKKQDTKIQETKHQMNKSGQRKSDLTPKKLLKKGIFTSNNIQNSYSKSPKKQMFNKTMTESTQNHLMKMTK